MRLCAFVLLAVLAPPGPPEALTASAAVSLTDALDELGPMYSASGGARVHFNYAASNALARQIVQGARVDVFISADERQMDVAVAAGAIDAATRVKLLGNTLIAVRRRGLPDASSDGLAVLRDPRYRRIAIGDPAAVPAGVYAKQVLARARLWDELQPKLVPVASVRAALAAVANGAADAAFVYASDMVLYRGSAIDVLGAWTGDSTGIVYPAAIVRTSRRRDEASRFLTFLCGERAAEVFRRHRFVPLGCR